MEPRLTEIEAPTSHVEAVAVGMAVGEIITRMAIDLDHEDLLDTESDDFDFAIAVCMDIIYLNTLQRGAYA